MAEKLTYADLEQRIEALEQENSNLRGIKSELTHRIESLTRPLLDVHIVFEDLFNLDDIQHIQDEFADITGVASIITHTDGTPITAPSNFSRLCKDIIRTTDKGLTNCFKSDAMLGRYNPGGPIIQQCISGGLWDAGAGITVGGKHIANWLIGQVRNDLQTEENMLEYAREIGANETDMLEAFREVKAMSLEQFQRIAGFLFTLANQLSTTAYQIVQQARFISERKTIEKALQESEERFRLAFLTSPDLISITRLADGVFIDSNEGFSRVFGYSRADVINKSSLALNIWKNVEDRKHLVEELSQKGFIENFEAELICKDGTVIIGLMSANTINIQGQNALISVTRDITRRKRTENELKRHREHLEDLIKERTAALENKNKELETFTYSVSHDLKAPLRGIDGYSRLLEEEYADKLDEEGLLFLKNIRQSSTQMNQLIEDLLAYSRMERRDIQPAPINLKTMFDSLIFQRAHDLKTRHITLSMRLPFQTIYSDIETMRQVLTNYLDNAIKFSRIDDSAVIEIGGQESNDAWTLWVKDNGIGFDPQYRDRIFEIFQRLHRSEDFPGTGIGLAIVRKAVERIGGRAWAESTLGHGALFSVDIPKKNNSFNDERERHEST